MWRLTFPLVLTVVNLLSKFKVASTHHCDVQSVLKSEPIPVPGLAIVFIPDVFGSELIDGKNETIWPISLAAGEAIAFRKLIKILGTMVENGFSLDKLLDIFESFGDNIFTLYKRLTESGIIDATDLNVFPEEYVDLLNNEELTVRPNKVIDYVLDVPIAVSGGNFRVSLYGNAIHEFEKMGECN